MSNFFDDNFIEIEDTYGNKIYLNPFHIEQITADYKKSKIHLCSGTDISMDINKKEVIEYLKKLTEEKKLKINRWGILDV